LLDCGTLPDQYDLIHTSTNTQIGRTKNKSHIHKPAAARSTPAVITNLIPLHPLDFLHRSATPTANPPNIPAPTPTTLCAPDVPVAEAAEFVADELTDAAAPVPLLAVEEAAELVDKALPVDATVPVELAAPFVEQATAEGRFVTPLIPQKLRAKLTAAVWSAGLQTSARQHAMVLRKVGLLHMQATSKLEQPPMLEPLVCAVTHGFYRESRLALR
jgi:hypothetical protein